MPETKKDYHHIPVKSAALFVPGSFRTIVLSKAEGILAVIGKLKTDPTGSTVIQKYMFDVKKWTMAEALKWVKEHQSKALELVIHIYFEMEKTFGVELPEEGLVDDIVSSALKDVSDVAKVEDGYFFKWMTEDDMI